MAHQNKADNNRNEFNGPARLQGFNTGSLQAETVHQNSFIYHNLPPSMMDPTPLSFRTVFDWLTADSRTYGKLLEGENKWKPVPCSGDWFSKHSKFIDWAVSEESCILGIYGPPNCGKTSLATRVSDFCKGKLSKDATIVTFFFITTPPKVAETEAGNIIRYLLSKVAFPEHGTAYSESVTAEYDRKCDQLVTIGEGHDTTTERVPSERPTWEECIDMLVGISKERPMVFALDGLNECAEQTRKIVMEALESLSKRSDKPVKIMVFSQPEDDIRAWVGKFQVTGDIDMTVDLTRGDIDLFVEAEFATVQQKLLSGRLTPALRDKILETLRAGARGNFSWVRSSVSLLAERQDVRDLVFQLGKLPHALTDVYDIWYGKASIPRNEATRTFEAAIGWLFCAQRPLKRQEIIAAVSLTCNKDYLSDELDLLVYSTVDPERSTSQHRLLKSEPRFIESCFDAILKVCQGFMVWDSAKDACHFSHASAREYLAQKPEFDDIVVNSNILKACLRTYVGNEDKMSTYCEDLERYACVWWPKHYTSLLKSGKLSDMQLQIQSFQMGNQTGGDSTPRPVHVWVKSFRKLLHQHVNLVGMLNEDKKYAHQLIAATALRCYLTKTSGIGPFTPGALEVFSVFGLSSTWILDLPSTGDLKTRCDLLCSAGEFGHIDTFMWLVERGVDFKRCRLAQYGVQKLDDGGFPLHLSAVGKCATIVQVLLDRGAPPDVLDSWGNTPLIYAAWLNDAKSAKALLHAGADLHLCVPKSTATPKSAEDWGRDISLTPIHIAASFGNVETLRVLLDQKPVDTSRGSGSRYGTPLMLAAVANRATAVDVLLKARAVPALKDYHGRTALWKAANSGHESIVLNLMHADSTCINSNDSSGRSPLMAAAAAGRGGVVKVLLSTDVLLKDARDSAGATALWLAARMGHDDVVQLLLDHKARMIPSIDRTTPLATAAARGHLGVVKVLLSSMPEHLVIKNDSGRSAVDEALSFNVEGKIKKVSRADIRRGMIDVMLTAARSRMSGRTMLDEDPTAKRDYDAGEKMTPSQLTSRLWEAYTRLRDARAVSNATEGEERTQARVTRTIR